MFQCDITDFKKSILFLESSTLIFRSRKQTNSLPLHNFAKVRYRLTRYHTTSISQVFSLVNYKELSVQYFLPKSRVFDNLITLV